MDCGYSACKEAVFLCKLEKPVVCQPFVIEYDCAKLEDVRDVFGYELYRKVMKDIEEKIC